MVIDAYKRAKDQEAEDEPEIMEGQAQQETKDQQGKGMKNNHHKRKGKKDQQEKGRDDNVRTVFTTLTGEQFIDCAQKEDACMNLLDLPNTQPDIPIFLRYVMTITLILLHS